LRAGEQDDSSVNWLLSAQTRFLIVHPTRLKWVETSKIAVFYNFYRFRGGLSALSNPPQTQTESLPNSRLVISYFCELVPFSVCGNIQSLLFILFSMR
jgi:hypothetical protein